MLLDPSFGGDCGLEVYEKEPPYDVSGSMLVGGGVVPPSSSSSTTTTSTSSAVASTAAEQPSSSLISFLDPSTETCLDQDMLPCLDNHSLDNVSMGIPVKNKQGIRLSAPSVLLSSLSVCCFLSLFAAFSVSLFLSLARPIGALFLKFWC